MIKHAILESRECHGSAFLIPCLSNIVAIVVDFHGALILYNIDVNMILGYLKKKVVIS